MNLRFFISLCAALSLTYSSLESYSSTFDKSKPRAFHIDLVNPVYRPDGLFSSKGGVISTNNFRLQASEIYQKETPEGSVIEAKGEILFFLNGHLLTGEKLVYNLKERSGVLTQGVIGFGNWCIGAQKIVLFPNQSIELEKAWISSDPSAQTSWKATSSRILLKKNDDLNFKNLSLRFFGLPLIWLPRFSTTVENLQNQPIDYDFVWKGSQKRKVSLRYRLYNSSALELSTRLEYLIGRGPGISLDGKLNVDNSTLQVKNFVARDNSVVNPDLKTRYRFKGHYQKSVNETASFNIFYDRYSDNDVPSDYDYSSFDNLEEGQTKIVLRDQKPSFTHQITHKVKLNPFQTVKKQLPSYFYTPHTLNTPWKSPWENFVSFRSHARAEYLSYDFSQFSQVHNYHSSRLFLESYADMPLPTSGIQITPSIGYKLASYNNSNRGELVTVAAPSAILDMQMMWIKAGYYSHCVQPFSRTLWIGNPLKNAEDHYIFDSRDAITSQAVQQLGVNQKWYRDTSAFAEFKIQSIWIKTGQEKKKESSIFQHFDISSYWNVTDRWKLLSEAQFSPSHIGRRSWNIRTEHTWSDHFANALEFRMRNTTTWRKNAQDDFSLESYRNPHQLKTSHLSDARKTLLSQFIYQPSPNWAYRFDTAHGWKREDSRAYSQYSMGVSTDLGSSWRLQFQISKTPLEWDWKIRIDLRDTPVTPPKPAF